MVQRTSGRSSVSSTRRSTASSARGSTKGSAAPKARPVGYSGVSSFSSKLESSKRPRSRSTDSMESSPRPKANPARKELAIVRSDSLPRLRRDFSDDIKTDGRLVVGRSQD